jgi:hypothetical protein
MWIHRKEPSLPATDSGPKPGDFPVGSLESRATARAMLERQDEVIAIRVIDCRSDHVRSDKPIGQTMLDGEVFEVYRDGKLLEKTGTDTLPWVRVPHAQLTVCIRDIGSSTSSLPSHSAKGSG